MYGITAPRQIASRQFCRIRLTAIVTMIIMNGRVQ
jgi:hypothetical protein